MTNFSKLYLIDAYHYHKKMMNFSGKSADIFFRPYFDLLNVMNPETKVSKYAEDILLKEKKAVTLIYLKELLVIYGFDEYRIKNFDHLELLKSYAKKGINFPLDDNTIITHVILSYIGEILNQGYNYKLSSLIAPLYVFKSIIFRLKLQKIARETNFSRHSFDLKPVFKHYNFLETLLIKAVKSWRKDAT